MAPRRRVNQPDPSERSRVHRDLHVEVAKALYLLLQEWIGQYLDAHADADVVELFHRGRLVKTHAGSLQAAGRAAATIYTPNGLGMRCAA